MNSFGVWYKPNNSAIESSLNLHINLWRLPYTIKRKWWFNKTTQKDFIDFGLKIDNYKEIEYIKFAIPFHVTDKNLFCLFDIIMDNKLLRPLFNQDMQIEHLEGSNCAKINSELNEDEKYRFNLTKFKNGNIQFSHVDEYSIVKMTIPSAVKKLAGNRLYFRFRINHEDVSNLTYCYRPKNSIFVSAFHVTEISEMLFNRKRNIPEEIGLQPGEKDFKLDLVNYFLLHEADDILIQSHKPLSSLRRLESDIWGKYINDSNYKFKNIFAYQWNDTAEENNFNALIKMRREKNNWKTILIFVLILAILTVSFNLVSNYFQCLLDK
jgi:hypothetical protein